MTAESGAPKTPEWRFVADRLAECLRWLYGTMPADQTVVQIEDALAWHEKATDALHVIGLDGTCEECSGPAAQIDGRDDA